MGLYSYIHLLSMIIHLLVGVYIIRLDRRSLENISAALVLICLAIWSCGHVLTHNIYATKDVALIGRKISSIGWIFFAPVTFYSFLVFTEKPRFYRNIFVVLLVPIVPVTLLVVELFSNDLTKDLVLNRYGWQPVWADTFWKTLYFCQLVLFTTASFVMTFNFMSITANTIKKHHADTVMLFGVSIFFFGFLSGLIHAYVALDLPRFESYVGIFWAMAMYISIRKNKYLVPLTNEEWGETS